MGIFNLDDVGYHRIKSYYAFTLVVGGLYLRYTLGKQLRLLGDSVYPRYCKREGCQKTLGFSELKFPMLLSTDEAVESCVRVLSFPGDFSLPEFSNSSLDIIRAWRQGAGKESSCQHEEDVSWVLWQFLKAGRRRWFSGSSLFSLDDIDWKENYGLASDSSSAAVVPNSSVAMTIRSERQQHTIFNPNMAEACAFVPY
ncbi:hypothetical protein HAX54_004786 [Datura stramonium]|uniref:Uncharacterized protein n=1 Tax=Datura stramonium TaxID=4076 RepID=A0ABS8T7I1_DATST|nr:hypothetical protein [Datura stramonium]